MRPSFFSDLSALALMSGCPACADGEVALEEGEPEATPASARTMRERKDDCRIEAKRLLARYGITEPLVDVERIAYGAGLLESFVASLQATVCLRATRSR